MSDSTENTKNLDSYGVWVKRPPQDAAETTENAIEETSISADDFAINEPVIAEDLSFDSNDNDTTLSDEELSNITNDIDLPEEEAPVVSPDTTEDFIDLPDFENNSEEPAFTEDTSNLNNLSLNDFETESTPSEASENTEEEISSDSGMPEIAENEELSADDFLNDTDFSSQDDGEISLDDFMDGGFSDPNPGSESAAASTSDEISIDDFFDDDSSAANKEDDVSNDEPLDIDLSFNENPNDQVPVEETENIENNAEIDTSEDDMFDNMEANAESAAASSNEESHDFDAAAFESSTEELSLDDFGIDENSDDATAVAAGAAVNASAESEEVDLSDFGIDSDAGETPVKQDVQAAKKNQVVDYDLAITDEDATVEAPTIEQVESPSDSAEAATITEENDNNTTKVDNSVLDMIMKELSGLKNEINSLKDEFEGLRNQETIPTPNTNDVSDSAIDEIPKSQENTGFFDGDDEDDTIALSGDELSNIMNTADFTETEENEIGEDEIEIPNELPEEYVTKETPEENQFINDEIISEETDNSDVKDDLSEEIEDSPFGSIEDTTAFEEEPDSGLSMDIDNDKLEEPNIEEVNNQLESEEIVLPKVDEIAKNSEDENLDNILVESSNQDLMDSVAESEIPVPPVAENESDEIPAVDDILADSEDTIPAKSKDELFEEYIAEDPSVSEGITEESIDYLKDEEISDSVIPEAEGAVATENSFPAAEISETPVDEANDKGLPDDLKNDVKSVLLYMDQLLENLPEEKIMEFAKSEQFSTYKKLFNELGLS